MKIVHVLPGLARGGGERLTIELANRQVDAGHEVTLVVGSSLPPERMHDGLDQRVKVHNVSSASGRTRYAAMLPWIWRHRSWVASQDVLHCHLTYGAIFGAAFRWMGGSRRGPAIVETYHAVGMPIPRALRWLHVRLATQWNGLTLMVDDPYWREFMRRHERIVSRIIPVGVEPSPKLSPAERKAYRETLGIPEDALVVTSIGRLVAERRPRSYIPVFARIAKAMGRNVHFLMGGDGPERQKIEAEAAASGIRDRLHLPGMVREIERPIAISNLYVTANVGPVPGVAGLQAVAAGLPTIAVQLSEDYSPASSDWIWSSRDVSEIAARAIELLRNPDTARELSRSQTAHLEKHHSAAAMAQAYECFYRDAIAAKARGSGGK